MRINGNRLNLKACGSKDGVVILPPAVWLLIGWWYYCRGLPLSKVKRRLHRRGLRVSLHHLYDHLANFDRKSFDSLPSPTTEIVTIEGQKFTHHHQTYYLYTGLDERGNLIDFFVSQEPQRRQAEKRWFKPRFFNDRSKLLPLTTIVLCSFLSLGLGLLTYYRAKIVPTNAMGQNTKARREQETSGDLIASSDLKPSYKAFLDTIAWAEGTLHADGYHTLFGGDVVEEIREEHPNECIVFYSQGRQRCSTAFGRYQILNISAENWSMTPEGQDRWALRALDKFGALEQLDQGDFAEAVYSSCRVWSSLPCHRGDSQGYYNQRIQSLKQLKAKYHERLQIYIDLDEAEQRE